MAARYGRTRTTLLGSAIGMAIAACYASAASATIIYNGASTYTVNTAINENIIVQNSAATLNVESGGVVQGVDESGILGAVRTQAGALNVTGTGQIIAGTGQAAAISMRGNPAVVTLSDQSTVTGNIVMEFNLSGWRQESTSSVRLYAQDQAVVNGDVIYAGFVRIQDDARINGDIRNADNGSISLDMRGGEVTGQVVFGGLNDYVFNMSGGSILGGFRGAAGYVDFTMTGGYIGGGVRTGDAVDGTISGGKIEGGLEFWNGTTSGDTNLVVTGGRFDTDAGEYLFSMTGERAYESSTATSSLDISGGQWGYEEAGLGFYFDEWSDFSITGWDLTFVDGVLSGYLLDGSWFSNLLTFGSDWHGTFTINNVTSPSVPEPGTLGLLAAGALGMMFARRRRVAAI